MGSGFRFTELERLSGASTHRSRPSIDALERKCCPRYIATKSAGFGELVRGDCNGPTDDVVKLRRNARRLEKSQFPDRPTLEIKGLRSV
jgi:hypothetical protein